LHPQLQYGLIRYLRSVTAERPDIQIIVSTHSGELVSACDPSELVIVRQINSGNIVARNLGKIPLPEHTKKRMLNQTRLHLDANRSGALFADKVLLVEGVTDAVVVRALGRVWASGDPRKLAFVGALAIFVVGHKIGEWPVRILATPDFELVKKVAVLGDTDFRSNDFEAFSPPAWHQYLAEETAKFFWSQPTLEPTLVTGNEALVARALTTLGIGFELPVSSTSIDNVFRGTASTHKGLFAMEIAALIDVTPSTTVPTHIVDLFDWLYIPGTQPTDPE